MATITKHSITTKDANEIIKLKLVIFSIELPEVIVLISATVITTVGKFVPIVGTDFPVGDRDVVDLTVAAPMAGISEGVLDIIVGDRLLVGVILVKGNLLGLIVGVLVIIGVMLGALLGDTLGLEIIGITVGILLGTLVGLDAVDAAAIGTVVGGFDTDGATLGDLLGGTAGLLDIVGIIVGTLLGVIVGILEILGLDVGVKEGLWN